MNEHRASIWIAAAVILLLTLATGPAVGLLSIPDPSPATLGSGSATLEIRSAPETATLSAGTYTEVHHLEVPEVVADVSNVTGSPLVTASIDIDELGYSRSSLFVLSEDSTGTHSFTISRDAIDSSRIQQDTYRGRLHIVLRDGSGRTTVLDQPIRVEVVE